MERVAKENKGKDLVKKDTYNYAGTVDVQFTKHNKIKSQIKQHNTGTKEFFKYILQSIVGYDVRSKMPGYVHVFNEIDEESIETILTSGNFNSINELSSCIVSVPASTKNIVYMNSEYYAQYKFLIPYNQISNDVQVIAFYNTPAYSSKEGLLAYVHLDEVQSIAGKKENMLITWSIKLSNIESES